MKTLRFYFLLLGLFLLINGTVEAQLQHQTIPQAIPQVSMTAANVFVTMPGEQLVLITINSNIPNVLFIDLHHAGETSPPLIAVNPYATLLSDNPTTTYSVIVTIPSGEQNLAKCGYIDEFANKHYANIDCIIPVEP